MSAAKFSRNRNRSAEDGSREFGFSRKSMDGTSSDGGSDGKSEFYEVIEYDVNDDADLSGMFGDLDKAIHIDENSPAAMALRANADVKVSSLGKAARAVHMQAVRKLAKNVIGAGKNGVIRGKPPRIPTRQDPSRSSLYKIDETEVAEGDPQTIKQHAEESIITDGVIAGTVKTGKEVLEHVDTHDLLKILRWRRKKKEASFTKKPKSYVKGKVIDGEHELYTLSIAVMIGVRTSISRTNKELSSGPGHRWVRPLDFNVAEKYEFRPRGGTLTPPHMLAHTFKFKDYAPVVFAYLRRMYGINEFDFLLSVCGNANFIEFISNAKSGQFFFYSSDGRYMIKTMTNAESKFLRRSKYHYNTVTFFFLNVDSIIYLTVLNPVLPEYFHHCAQYPNTMVTRFFGMYRVKLYHLRRNVKFVIMNSVYYTDKYLQTFYDLKGSTIGRESRPGQAVKKDNDLRKALPEEAIALPPKQRQRLRDQLIADCDFLKRMHVMDYSMLVGIHHIPPIDDQSIARIGFRPSMYIPQAKAGIDIDFETGSSGSGEESLHLDLTDSPRGRRTTMFPQPPSEAAKNADHSESQRARRSKSELHKHPQLGESTLGDLFFHDGLDEDDSSYLLGSDQRPDSGPRFGEETEHKMQNTVEKLYWPFHRFFDIHGHRRMEPVKCYKCSHAPCDCSDNVEALNGFSIPAFIPPISDRKDGAFEMDTTGLKLPLTFQGPQGDQLYQGKIFYMGVIDILQEYTPRKMLESKYRGFSAGRGQASAVAPSEYGQRFLEFFDLYTKREPKTS